MENNLVNLLMDKCEKERVNYIECFNSEKPKKEKNIECTNKLRDVSICYNKYIREHKVKNKTDV
jgi:hypothetical protein